MISVVPDILPTFDALEDWRLVGGIPATRATEKSQQGVKIHSLVTVVHHLNLNI